MQRFNINFLNRVKFTFHNFFFFKMFKFQLLSKENFFNYYPKQIIIIKLQINYNLRFKMLGINFAILYVELFK